MDVLEFKKAWALYNDTIPDIVVDIYINGERLLDKIDALRREKNGDYDTNGLLTPESVCYALLSSWKERSFNYIFGCKACGESGCDPVNVDIRACGDNIVWENISFYVCTDAGKEELQLPDTFIFSGKEYFEQVLSLRSWFFDTYRYYRCGRKFRKHSLISMEKKTIQRSHRFAQEIFDFADEKRSTCNSTTDYEELKEIYETAAFAGNTAAMNNLGVLYHNGLLGEKDYGKALEWYVRAARGRRDYAVIGNKTYFLYYSPGEIGAKVNIAKLYEYGLGVDANGEAAFELYQEAITDGDLTAYYDLARCYEKGIGTDVDTNKAIKYYKIAIKNGSLDALAKMGWYYYNGIIVPRDGDMAHDLLKKAVNRGDAGACCYLAQYYYDGIYIAKDYNKVLQYLRLGVARGNSQCMSNLGLMYEKGYGVEKNMIKAAEWYEKAKITR